MKKLSIKDETVREAYRRNTAVSDELRDMQDRKAADKRLAKKLEKMEKEALTEARQSVVMNGAEGGWETGGRARGLWLRSLSWQRECPFPHILPRFCPSAPLPTASFPLQQPSS